MFLRIRKRFTYTNVALTIALVFAMTGGAYAAKHYLITSTKQISPKVLSALKGKNGTNGTNGSNGINGKDGAPGARGPAGLEGPKGEKGEQGLPGEKGEKGAKGDTGSQGPKGEPWTPNNVLPSGATEKGAWAASGKPANFFGSELVFAQISFTVPMAKGLVGGEGCAETGPRTKPCEVHVIEAGQHGEGKFEAGVAGHDGPNTGCPTTSEASKPEAEPGNLCIFVKVSINAGKVEPTDPGEGTSEAAGPTGSVVWVHASATPITGTEGVLIGGSWAATAP